MACAPELLTHGSWLQWPQSNHSFVMTCFFLLLEKQWPSAFLWTHNSLQRAQQPLIPNLGLSALSWQPGEPPPQSPTFAGRAFRFGGGVKCWGNEGVSDISLLTLLAVAFAGEKEMPQNNSFNCFIKDLLILKLNPPFCCESHILQALYPSTSSLTMTQISHRMCFFLQPPDTFPSGRHISCAQKLCRWGP